MSAFTRDLDVLMSVFNTQKHSLLSNLEKNYRENVHYIKLPVTAAVGDLCFIDDFIAVECDEYGHINMSEFDEKTREDYIINQGYTLIRYNPNDAAFDLSDVLSKINVSLIMKGAFIK